VRRHLGGEAGFSIVEVVIAVLVLVVGVLAVLGMLSGAIRSTASNNQYLGATNVARELVETARGADYDQLTPTLIGQTLQASGMGSGTPWTITRRGVTYTISATACALDSPADKLESPVPANACTPQLAGSTGDQNGDDFRRVTFNVAWTSGSQARSLTQTELIVNPSGGLGPRIKTVAPLTQTITNSATTVASVTFTTSPAAVVHWHADDGKGQGDAVLSPSVANSWRADWALGTTGSGSEVLDGAYQMIAQAFDDRGVAGDAKLASIVLNRRKPYAPPTFAGGYNSRLDLSVDLTWGLNSERDIAGYRVYWTGLDGILGSGIDVQVCPRPWVASMLSTTTTSCTDSLPLVSGLTKYSVVALDRDSTGALREGDERSFTVSAVGTRPSAPRGPLVASTVAGAATLSWTAPSSGSPIFYRIYRDGTDRADRYDRTAGAVTSWTDGAATTTHDYWITAVDSTYNESDPIGPVRWSPP
jgi:type II secretory pathway pseudopilin PulG